MTMRRATAKSSGWNMSLRASVLLWVLFIPTALFAGVNFDGVNSPGSGDDVLACGSDASVYNQEPFTIAAWIYPESTGEGSIGRIWCKQNTGETGYACFYMHNQTNPRIRFDKDYSPTSDLIVISANDSVVFNTWQAVLMTWDGSATATNVHLYANGTETSYATQTNGDNTKVSDAANAIYIGNRQGADRTFDGVITEVAFWDKVLDAQEIAQYALSRVKGMALQIAPANLIGYWPLWECGNAATCSGTFRNMSPNDNANLADCTPSNSPTGVAEAVLSVP